MPLSRRSVILSACGALGLVAIGGAWRVTRLPQTALQPWTLDPVPPADVRLDAFRHAILAPNPHNRQPWLIQLKGTSEAVITCDLSRRLPQTDPFDRQIVIGFGAFLELAQMAAAERGVRMIIAPFPDGEPAPRLDERPIAHLTFREDSGLVRDPLFRQIPKRRSTKIPYDMTRSVSDALIAEIAAAGGHGIDARGTNDPTRVTQLRDVILDAGRIEVTTPRTFQESIDVMRIGHAEIDANPDGIRLQGPMIETLKLTGQISREQIGDPSGSAFKSGMDRFRLTYGTAPAHLWLSTAGNTRMDQIAAGRAYVRANLKATELGLSLHPASQALQEYPEMDQPFARIHRLLDISAPGRVQMLARLGYADPVGPAPRWPLEAKLRRA